MVYDCFNRYTKRDPIGVGTFPIPNVDCDIDKICAHLNEENDNKNRKLSLYVHIPFCKKFCYFCGLNRYMYDKGKVAKYVNELVQEMKLYAETRYIKSLKISSVYFGGGTPTVLSNQQMTKLLESIFDYFPTEDQVEITIEGTIQSFNEERLNILRENGVTRISTGIQSFDEQVRRGLNLDTNTETILSCIGFIKKVFENFNLDLIYNLPGQSMESYENDLKIALKIIDTPHLTINPFVLLRNAHLYKDMKKGKIPFPSQQKEMEIFEHSLEIIGSYGREQYSVRDFCKKNCYCQYIVHNAYCNDVLALGAGAFGYLNGMVYTNYSKTKIYGESIENGYYPIDKFKICSKIDILKRFMLMALRLTQVDISKSIEKIGIDALSFFKERLQELEDEGFINISGNKISFTKSGLFWANNIRGEFANINEIDYIGYALKGAGKIGRGNFI